MTLHQREQEKYEEGLAQGLEQGLEQGRLLQLIELVEKGKLSLQDAAEIVDMSIEEFKQKMEEIKEM